MWKWFGSLVLVALFAGCLSQSVSEEEGRDSAGRVRVNGLYKRVVVNLSTGDTDRTFCRFYRFRNDSTYEVSEVAYLPPFVFDTVAHADTTGRFMLFWQERGKFSLGTDSISFLGPEVRMIGMDDQFEPWGPGLGSYPEHIATTYRVFTSDMWITKPEYNRIGRQVVDSFCLVMKRIGDENREIPLADLKL